MGYSDGLFGRSGEGVWAAKASQQHNDIQSVQNLEAVINEGLVLPCWRKLRMIHWMCCWSIWEKR